MKLTIRLRRRPWHWIVIVMVMFGALGYAVFFSMLFSLKEIDCKLERWDSQVSVDPCSEVWLAELDRYRGIKIWQLDTREAGRMLELADQRIKTVDFTVLLPDRLRVTVIGRRPVAQIANSFQADSVVLVDDEGVIVDQAAIGRELPLIVWSEIGDWALELALPQELKRAVTLSVFVD